MEHPTISILIPTLGRTKGLGKCLQSIVMLNIAPNLLELWVKEDCGHIGVPKMVKQGVEETTGEWIVYASNDIEFTPNSISEALKVYELTGKRLISFNTGEVYPDRGNELEHFMVKRDMLPLLDKGEVFDLDFHHLGVDNYLLAQGEKLNEYARAANAIVNHNHFTKGAEFDSTYKLGWSRVEEDRKLLKEKLARLENSTI